jgi:hypothetical protein
LPSPATSVSQIFLKRIARLCELFI